MMDVGVSRTNTLAEGMIERTSSMTDKIVSYTAQSRGQWSKEEKLVRNFISKTSQKHK